jgi:hypothetical protein
VKEKILAGFYHFEYEMLPYLQATPELNSDESSSILTEKVKQLNKQTYPECH